MGEHAQGRGSTGSLQPPATPARFNTVDHDYDAAADDYHDDNAAPDYDHNYDAAAHHAHDAAPHYDDNNPKAVDHCGQAWFSHRLRRHPPRRLRFRGVWDQEQRSDRH